MPMRIFKRPEIYSLLAGLCLSGLSVSAMAEETVNLRAADIHDADYPTVRGVQSMADQLAA